ncbi:unnamed protein product [Paramecium pentaurelia]|uniref:Arrestin C-terminal-like domain-containing protein n=1 Tax=Paramecium pentaurelia TaxID=43138 RepID=A0A8S1VZU3_9CILI|nr:unnamed protein product [Paramecium pentaurelia]
MNRNVLFKFYDPVTLAGDQIRGECYLRITEEIPKAQIVLTFQTKMYSKIIEKRQIPYDQSNPQMIPEKLVEKTQRIQVTLDSPLRQPKQTQKKYELNGEIMYRVIRHYGTHESFVYTQELYTGQVKPGDYKFQFSIPTQYNMSSSFSYKSEDGLKQAKCGYKVTLRVDLPDEASTLMMESADVFINGRVTSEGEQFRQCEGNIVQYLCLNRGTVELSLKLNKNNFIPGEQIQVEYTLDNTRSQRSISRVEARLINKITFIDDDEIERIIENIKVFQQNLGGVNSGQKLERQNASLEIPKNLRATIKTSVIRNQYFLQMEAIADAFLTWLSVPVVCQIPINIQESQLPHKINLEGWNFLPIMNVSVNAFSNLTVQQSFIPT